MKNFKQMFGMRTGLAAAGLAGVIALPVLAQAASVEVGGQLRYRGEYNQRDFNDKTSGEWANTQRSRVNVKYDNDHYHGFLQVQDVETFGGADNGMNFHQAFLKVDDVLGTGVGVQVGRQEINFADQRLVGAINWSQTAQSLDGLVLSRAFGDQGVVIPFFLQLGENDTPGANQKQTVEEKDVWATGFHSVWNVAKDHSFQPHVYYVRNGGNDINLYTLGFYYTGKMDPVSYDFAADYQTGDMGVMDISAYMVSGHVFFTSGPFKVGAGVDYLSGDGDQTANDTDIKNFTTLLATNHKFYGYMDYFNANLGNSIAGTDGTQNLGLIDYQLKGSYAVDKATSVGADLHYFQTAESTASTGADVRLAGEDTLGTELDLTVKHKTGPVTLQAGWSAFFMDNAMEAKLFPNNFDTNTTNDVSTDDIGYWGYVMASLNF